MEEKRIALTTQPSKIKCLLNLPDEILSKIASYLTEDDLFWNFGFTCQRLRNISLDTVKIIAPFESPINSAENQFRYILGCNDVVQAIRHIGIGYPSYEPFKEEIRKIPEDSNKKGKILVIDDGLITNHTAIEIRHKFAHLQGLLIDGGFGMTEFVTMIMPLFNLETIDLRHPGFDVSKLISAIGTSCKELKSISLLGCMFTTNEGIKKVFTNCNKLEMVTLEEFFNSINDLPIIALAENCKSLKYLNLDYCTNVSDQSISTIAAYCVGMEVFSLRRTQVTDKSIAAIGENCRELRVLNASCCSITSKSIEMIGQSCRKLENLDIINASGVMSLECLKLIANRCLKLKRIHLGFQNIPFKFGNHRNQHNSMTKYRIDSDKIVQSEAPIIAQEIGIQPIQLCLEGLVVNQNGTVSHCSSIFGIRGFTSCISENQQQSHKF